MRRTLVRRKCWDSEEEKPGELPGMQENIAKSGRSGSTLSFPAPARVTVNKLLNLCDL